MEQGYDDIKRGVSHEHPHYHEIKGTLSIEIIEEWICLLLGETLTSPLILSSS